MVSKNTHLTLENRKIIELGLNENWGVSSIANTMNKSFSTITREIEKRKNYLFPSSFNNSKNVCKNYNCCQVKSQECYKTCKNIEAYIDKCPKLERSPHVCNGCTSKSGCRHVKIYYKAYEANDKYEISWKEDRIGIRYTDDELKVLNTDFYDLVIKTRSIYHSLTVINKRGYHFVKRTIYHQIKKNELRLKYPDLPRNRKSKKEKLDTNYKNPSPITGHMYDDYIMYTTSHENAIETQMDTVIGLPNSDDSVMLTLEIVKISFMLIFKMKRKNFDETLKALCNLEQNIEKERFKTILEVLLTDNGSEFKCLDKIIETFPEINIFYCHPYSSYEKGNIENNHELIRRVIPKGISLSPYTQEDYNILASNMNSLYREKLDGKCPFELVEEYIPIKILEKMGLKRIEEDKVNMTPFCLGDKNIANIKRYLNNAEIVKANISITNKD